MGLRHDDITGQFLRFMFSDLIIYSIIGTCGQFMLPQTESERMKTQERL